jgi:hypothetical protein
MSTKQFVFDAILIVGGISMIVLMFANRSEIGRPETLSQGTLMTLWFAGGGAMGGGICHLILNRLGLGIIIGLAIQLLIVWLLSAGHIQA